jgi:hypothetical protein
MTHEERLARARAYAAWQKVKDETTAQRDKLQGIVTRVLSVLRPLYALLPSAVKTLVDEIKEEIGS